MQGDQRVLDRQESGHGAGTLLQRQKFDI
ncbi:hypothetical protein GGD84_002598 [Rhodothalassium salexigens DSM 2132]|nr:hypothetical protein [Rhodothalassium salexigens DSM 2132]